MIDPDLTLTSQERGELRTMTQLRGYEHLQRLALAECARFDVQLKNVEPSSANYEQELRQYHALAKAASQMWQGLMQRVVEEVSALEMEKKRSKKLTDLTVDDIEPDPTEETLA